MNALLVLLRYKLLLAWRHVKDNLFTLVVLGPMILGVVYMIAVPYLRALSEGVYTPPAPAGAQLALAALVLLLLLAPTSSIAARFYPLQSPDAYLDTLPITVGSRFIALALSRIGRNLTFAIALTALHYFIMRMGNRPTELLELTLLLLAPAVLHLSALQILFVLLAAHFNLLRLSRLLPIVGVLFVTAALLPATRVLIFAPLAGLLDLLATLLNHWFNVGNIRQGRYLLALLLAALYLSAAFLMYRAWQVSDHEAVARALGTRHRIRGLKRVTEAVARLTGGNVAAHLLRDLLLTFRFFSSAVYVSFAVAALFQLALVVFAFRVADSGNWFELGAQSACALSTFALAALAPALVKHQLGYLWLERALPVDKEDLYKNKLWYARLISLPALIVCAVIAPSVGSLGDATNLAFLLLKMALVWLLVSSLVGALAFEITSRPGLAIPFTAIASLSIASLTIRVWWLWLLVYPYIMDKLEQRGHERAHILLIGLEGDDD